MNFFDRWIQKKVDKALLEQKAAPIYQQGVRYRVDNGRIVTPDVNKSSFVRDGYSVNDIIYSVIQMILDKVRLPDWELFQVVDPSSLKKYKRLIALMVQNGFDAKQMKEALKYKDQGLKPITSFNLQAGKLNDLLTYPNEEYTWQDLVVYGNLFKMLTGDTYLWGELLTQGANAGVPNSVWVLPSYYMNIKVTDDFPAKVSSYEIFNPFNKPFSKEEILHLKYPNPNWNINGSQLYGFAPLQAFMKNTNRNNSAKDASLAKFQNGGLEEIVFMNDERFNSDGKGKQQIQALKDQLANEYGGPNNQGKFAISGYPVGKVGLGLSPVELGIIDSEKWDAIMFCNCYGVPPEMLGLIPRTYNTAKEAEKQLTLRSAIPLLTDLRNYLNWKIMTDWGFKGQNIYIDHSLDCFPELQNDLTETATWLQTLIMITPDEQREHLDLEALNTPESKEIWVKTSSGYVPLTDYQQSVIDQQLMQESIANGATNAQGTEQNGGASNSANGTSKAGLPNGDGKDLQFAKIF